MIPEEYLANAICSGCYCPSDDHERCEDTKCGTLTLIRQALNVTSDLIKDPTHYHCSQRQKYYGKCTYCALPGSGETEKAFSLVANNVRASQRLPAVPPEMRKPIELKAPKGKNGIMNLVLMQPILHLKREGQNATEFDTVLLTQTGPYVTTCKTCSKRSYSVGVVGFDDNHHSIDGRRILCFECHKPVMMYKSHVLMNDVNKNHPLRFRQIFGTKVHQLIRRRTTR